jgi:hypothetical protein
MQDSLGEFWNQKTRSRHEHIEPAMQELVSINVRKPVGDATEAVGSFLLYAASYLSSWVIEDLGTSPYLPQGSRPVASWL